MSTEIYFVRHGQTDWNSQLKIQGSSDRVLNEHGIGQAQALANALKAKGVFFEKIWASPLKRAFKTAEILGQVLDREVLLSRELREFDFGEWEGRTAQEIADKKAVEHWLSHAFSVPAPQGEEFAQVQKRLQFFLDESLLLKAQKPVAVVSHQGTLVALKSLLTQKKDVKSLCSYRQANDEFDVMDTSQLILQRFKI